MSWGLWKPSCARYPGLCPSASILQDGSLELERADEGETGTGSETLGDAMVDWGIEEDVDETDAAR